MTRNNAIDYVRQNYPYDDESEYCTVVKLRHSAAILPEIGCDGSIRDSSEWAYLDMTGKVDTGEYGEIYYFGGNENE